MDFDILVRDVSYRNLSPFYLTPTLHLCIAGIQQIKTEYTELKNGTYFRYVFVATKRNIFDVCRDKLIHLPMGYELHT